MTTTPRTAATATTYPGQALAPMNILLTVHEVARHAICARMPLAPTDTAAVLAHLVGVFGSTLVADAGVDLEELRRLAEDEETRAKKPTRFASFITEDGHVVELEAQSAQGIAAELSEDPRAPGYPIRVYDAAGAPRGWARRAVDGYTQDRAGAATVRTWSET